MSTTYNMFYMLTKFTLKLCVMRNEVLGLQFSISPHVPSNYSPYHKCDMMDVVVAFSGKGDALIVYYSEICRCTYIGMRKHMPHAVNQIVQCHIAHPVIILRNKKQDSKILS